MTSIAWAIVLAIILNLSEDVLLKLGTPKFINHIIIFSFSILCICTIKELSK